VLLLRAGRRPALGLHHQLGEQRARQLTSAARSDDDE
jgi:hypothetical protein